MIKIGFKVKHFWHSRGVNFFCIIFCSLLKLFLFVLNVLLLKSYNWLQGLHSDILLQKNNLTPTYYPENVYAVTRARKTALFNILHNKVSPFSFTIMNGLIKNHNLVIFYKAYVPTERRHFIRSSHITGA